jgi:hypothetical protein
VSATASPAPSAEAIGLARRIMKAEHREALVRSIYAKQLRVAMPICKSDARCQSDLDHAIASATNEMAREQSEDMAQLLARKLTPEDMRAALKFYNSPQGKRTVAALEDSTDQLAQMGHASAVQVQKSISKTFCPAHPEVCVNDLGRHPATTPRS